jgi:hypothetical protein
MSACTQDILLDGWMDGCMDGSLGIIVDIGWGGFLLGKQSVGLIKPQEDLGFTEDFNFGEKLSIYFF